MFTSLSGNVDIDADEKRGRNLFEPSGLAALK